MLPIIDFKQCRPGVEVSDKEINETAKLLVDALSTVGFAYLKNCGIKRETVEEARNTADEIFNAPTDKKKIYKRNPITTFGYIGFSTEKVDPALPFDYKEAFNVPGCALDPSVGAKWPHELSPNFAPLTKSFMEECKSLSLILLEVIAVGLQLKDRHVLENAHQHLNLKHSFGGALKYLYYPPIKDDVKPEQKRLGEHSDWGSITLLFVDNTGGLQKHRINIPQKEWRRNSIRRSIVYFAYPDNDVVINQPLQFKGDADVPDPVKDPITALKYCEIKMKEAHYVY
ncbi:uncharacterized protein LOC100177618 isoform X2 [Ciona intestinalis]